MTHFTKIRENVFLLSIFTKVNSIKIPNIGAFKLNRMLTVSIKKIWNLKIMTQNMLELATIKYLVSGILRW